MSRTSYIETHPIPKKYRTTENTELFCCFFQSNKLHKPNKLNKLKTLFTCRTCRNCSYFNPINSINPTNPISQHSNASTHLRTNYRIATDLHGYTLIFLLFFNAKR